MNWAKKHWGWLALGAGVLYAMYAMKSYGRYIAMRDAALRTQGVNPYKWTWLPFGPGNPFTH